MLRNPRRPVTIYEIAVFVGQAPLRTMTITNISYAFSKCGIFPFDLHIFTKLIFWPNNVPDRLVPANNGPNSEIVSQNEQYSKAMSSPTSPRNVSILENISTPEPSLGSSSRDNNSSLIPSTDFTLEAAAINKENEKERTKSLVNLVSPKDFRPPIKSGPTSNKS